MQVSNESSPSLVSIQRRISRDLYLDTVYSVYQGEMEYPSFLF